MGTHGFGNAYLLLQLMVFSTNALDIKIEPANIYIDAVSSTVTCANEDDMRLSFMTLQLLDENDEVAAGLNCEWNDGWNYNSYGPQIANHKLTCLQQQDRTQVHAVMAINFNRNMKYMTFQCYAGVFACPDQFLHSPNKTIMELFEAPVRVDFTVFEFDDSSPVIGRKIYVKCTSVGAIPASQYVYTIESRNRERSITFKPIDTYGVAEFLLTENFKSGFKVTCTDVIHTLGKLSQEHTCPFDKDPNYCIASYLSIRGLTSERQTLSPCSTNYLYCEVNAYPRLNVSFMWTKPNSMVSLSSGYALMLPADEKKDQTSETYICRARFSSLEARKTWDVDYMKCPAHCKSYSGLAIGIALAIVFFLIFFYVYWRMKGYQRTNVNSNRPSDQAMMMQPIVPRATPPPPGRAAIQSSVSAEL